MDCPFRVPEFTTWEWCPCNGGDQFRFKFTNGWGASVVRHSFSYGVSEGKWELAVEGKDGDLNYNHPVSHGDVRGWLSEDDVSRLLAEIAATPADAVFTERAVSP